MSTRQGFTRRSFLRGALAAGGGLIAAGIGYTAYRNQAGRHLDPARSRAALAGIHPSPDPGELPNIVLILADDLGYGDLTPYGATSIDTPNLARLASQGVLMTRFDACSPVCSPSRAGLLTGRYAQRALVAMPYCVTGSPMQYFLSAIGFFPCNMLGIPADELLLPQLLRARGYATGMVGKWHLGDRSPSLPNDCGFDSFYGALYANDTQPYAIYRDRAIEVPAPADQDVLTQTHTREALRFIQANRDRPFFLYLAYPAPHEPIHASREFRGRSRAGLYGDAVEEIDWSVGQVLQALAEYSLEGKTLVIFTSDNGPWWQGSPGGMRGRKNTVLEGGLRVPLIARWPGAIPAGRVTGEFAVNFDLFATCLAAAGVPLPADRIIDGRDLLPLWQGRAPSPHDAFYYYDGQLLVAVRRGPWKYVRGHRSDNGGFPLLHQGPFLFNLERDPDESYSLIESESELAREMAALLDAWDAQTRANPRGWLAQGR